MPEASVSSHARVIRNVTTDLSTDILVIGSGPGGAMSAYTLAQAGRDVLMVDAGSCHEPFDKPAFSLAELRHKYWNSGLTFTLGNPKIMYAMGFCVGGGSEVNNGEFPSLPDEVLARWQERFDVRDISSSELAAHREFCAGKLAAEYETDEVPSAVKLRTGAAACNWRVEAVPRCFNRQTQQAMSMSKSFIPESLEAGCRLLPEATVRRLRRSAAGWSTELTVQGRRIKAKSSAVFLCAGAVQTPVILMRSGFRRNVGRLFQCQPMLKVTARFPEKVNYPGMGIPSLQVMEFAPGIILGCAVSTPPYMALNMHPHISDHQAFKTEWEYHANYYAMIAPEGVGRIRPVPFMREPLLPYQLTDTDIHTLYDGLKKLSRLLFEAGATCVIPSVHHAGYVMNGPDAVNRLPATLPRRQSQLTAVHLSSGCPMGENRDLAAVDSFGNVFGASGLVVSDCSIMCTAPSVNPQATIMSLARRNAQHYLNAS